MSEGGPERRKTEERRKMTKEGWEGRREGKGRAGTLMLPTDVHIIVPTFSIILSGINQRPQCNKDKVCNLFLPGN